MKIAFRADASTDIGSGHVMRCLALADALRAQGDETLFLCRDLPGHLCDAIAARGHPVHRLPAPDAPNPAADGDLAHAAWLGVGWQHDAAECAAALARGHPDWLVVDHYAIDHRWENMLRGECGEIMIIDDLADRRHDCELLLDQNLQSRPNRYAERLPPTCRRLIGPRFALLRPEFASARQTLRQRDGQLRRLLVFLGGGDAHNFTGATLRALGTSGVADRLRIDVAIGSSHRASAEIAALCDALPNTRLHVQTEQMAQLMCDADLMIGAAGGTTWERCCLGLPAILFSVADNQRENGQQIARRRAAIYAGDATPASIANLGATLHQLCERPGLLRHLSRRALGISEGRGVALVSLTLHADDIVLRRAGTEDCGFVWRWRNDLRTRQTAFDTGTIDLPAHRAWYEQTLQRSDRQLLIGSIGGQPIGVLRYDLNASTAEISVYLDPDLHGLGLGTRLIAAGNRWIEKFATSIKEVLARIRAENAASWQAFRNAGFLPHEAAMRWQPAPAPTEQ